MQIQKSKYNSIGIIASIILFLLTLVIFSPTANMPVNAAETTPTTAPSSISMGLQSNIEIDVTPTANGTFQATTAKLTVATDSSSGYTLHMHTTNGQNTLIGTGTNTSNITSITENSTANDFPRNTWGYAITTNDATDILYQPIPTTSDETIASSYNTTGNYDLIFATKIDTTLPSDQYSNSVIVSAVANPRQVTLLDITNMQDMNSGICANTPEGTEVQLTDTRDSKSYWVAKLKDGNCWMTQNLALDITTAGLKASDTDITSDWDNSSPIPPIPTENTLSPIDGEAIENISAHSYNPGKYTLGTPTLTASCNQEDDTETKITNLSMCEHIAFVPIDNTWNPNFEAKDGVYNGPGDYNNQQTYTTLDYINKRYDPHYLVGNYYGWTTATAGTESELTGNGSTTGSICPKNWQLPNRYDNKSWRTMLKLYLPNYKVNETVDGIDYNAATNPLHLVRSGTIGNTNTISSAGRKAYYITNYRLLSEESKVNISTPLTIDAEKILVTSYNTTQDRISVRCVAR